MLQRNRIHRSAARMPAGRFPVTHNEADPMDAPAPTQEAIELKKALRGYYIEELEVGMSAFYSRTITEADLVLFAGMSGDYNPLHLNREFAEQTQFGGPIAHGMLTASLISTVVGTKLPGHGAIYMAQNIRFTAPVRPGDTVTARATVTEIDRERRRVKLDTTCTVRGNFVVKGDAMLLVPSRESEEAGD